ncbi:hypothetical protein [Vibrio vulnificus YJ016]|uniref:Uncharacterized protein n=1 Tax=Vibrio vulnificus (strain YJ016) TaxID=196600 RepID=Q7MDA5_VIBVY|nr:hypothetical protein [Vibrio vulnificus YJ016]
MSIPKPHHNHSKGDNHGAKESWCKGNMVQGKAKFAVTGG